MYLRTFLCYSLYKFYVGSLSIVKTEYSGRKSDGTGRSYVKHVQRRISIELFQY